MSLDVYWTKELAVGVPQIDREHQELFDRVDQVVKACNGGNCTDETLRLLDFLHQYVVSHFSAEECLMERFAYPASQRHRNEHIRFCSRLDKLEATLGRQPDPKETISRINEMVVDWLFEHVCMDDRHLGRFLQEQGILHRSAGGCRTS